MRTISLFKTLLITASLTFAVACGNKTENAENEEQGKVGDVYNEEEQGVQHENRDNQFQQSRSDNKEGNGLETGAPTDTIDGDGDNVKAQ